MYSWTCWEIGGDREGRSTGPSEDPRLRTTSDSWATKRARPTEPCLAIEAAGLASRVVDAHEHVECLLETLKYLLVAAWIDRTTILAVAIHIWRRKETMRNERVGVAYVGLVWVRMVVVVVVGMVM